MPQNIGLNICHTNNKSYESNKIAGLTNTVTPSCVGKCLRLTFSSDLEEAMFETGKSLSAISKFDSVLEKNQPIYNSSLIFGLLLFNVGLIRVESTIHVVLPFILTSKQYHKCK